jgi:hypothetical protein
MTKRSNLSPRVRAGSQSTKHKKVSPSVPRELAVFLCLPPSVGSVRDYEWFAPVQTDPPAPLNFRKMLLSLEAERPPRRTPEQTAAEVERVMALPPAEFKKWVAEQQQRNDALLANLMPWGGLA